MVSTNTLCRSGFSAKSGSIIMLRTVKLGSSGEYKLLIKVRIYEKGLIQ